MAFVVETGAGLSNANSYLSVADADSYHTDHSGSTDWSGASEADKQKALRLATQYLDITYHGRWRGVRCLSTQVLAWPRIGAVDDDEYLIDEDALPQQLEDACAELALKVIEGDTLIEDFDAPGTVKAEKVKIGPIEESKEYMGGNSPVKKYTTVERLIRSLIESSDTVSRG